MAPFAFKEPKPTKLEPRKDLQKFKSCLRKRNFTLKKKVLELATLCDVKVCMICLDIDGTVETWPENRAEVREMVEKYFDQSKKAEGKEDIGEESFVSSESRENLREKFGLADSVNGDALFTERMSWNSLVGLSDILEKKLHALRERIEVLNFIVEKENSVLIDDEFGFAVSDYYSTPSMNEAFPLPCASDLPSFRSVWEVKTEFGISNAGNHQFGSEDRKALPSLMESWNDFLSYNEMKTKSQTLPHQEALSPIWAWQDQPALTLTSQEPVW